MITVESPAPTPARDIQQLLSKRSSSRRRMNSGWEGISTDHPTSGLALSLCLT